MASCSPWTLDFETEKIDRARPHVAPKPVGLAVRDPRGRCRYYAWGHPEGNNAIREDAKRVLVQAWRDDRPLLFHNAPFDLAVAEQHFRFPWPQPDRIEDTRVLAFLADPYRVRLDLKDLAEDLLGLPPDEQAELYDWIRAHVPEARRRKDVGAFIARAPGGLVGRYAVGDVERTYCLWRLFEPVRRVPAYRALEIPSLEVAQRLSERGAPVDVPLVERVAREAPFHVERLERAVRRRLGLPAGSPLSGDEGRALVADAVEAQGWVDPDGWVLGEKEERLLAHGHLAALLPPDRKARGFLADWRARGLLLWQLRTLARPWLARQEGGRVHASWNTTRIAEGGRLAGARTGRLSSSPNFQNIGKASPPGGLPNPRDWVRAPRGRRLVGGDLSGQEPRIQAHFAGGRMAEQYQRDPRYDPHGDVAILMACTRDAGKVNGLATPYGRGASAIAADLGISVPEAHDLKRRFWRARPELAQLFDALTRAWAQGRVVVTWAGWEVRCEPTPEEPGRWAYRALNTLVQASAAQQLKAAMVLAHRAAVPVVLSVHDELVAEVPYREARDAARELERCLVSTDEFFPWSVPFVADAKIGKTWRETK